MTNINTEKLRKSLTADRLAEQSKTEAAFNDANSKCDALAAALQAMAYYGSGSEQMAFIGTLHIAALRQAADAFKRLEAERSGATNG